MFFENRIKNTMRLAAIIITYNDGYKLKEWCRWYEDYKDEISLLVIVDNGSEPEYLHQVESFFKDATIIKRKTNGGCTSAYNDGIRLALSDSEITHIALIANDTRLEKGALTKCVELLESEPELGMVAPVLLEADSDVVADFGCSINSDLSMNPYAVGISLSKLSPEVRFCEAVTGGMNVSKRSFYETTVGLQDENLFMYSDEVDMGLRARKVGVKMAVTKEAVAWHQHINAPGKKLRHPFSNYLIARNKVYLGKKHYGRGKQWSIFCHYFIFNLFFFLKSVLTLNFDQLIYPRWGMLGALFGLFGNMKENKYSKI